MTDASIILLHADMLDKQGNRITTSITTIDVHDISRSARTFGLRNFFVAHPSPSLRSLTKTLKQHWDEGFGATYNPNRKEALDLMTVVEDLDQAIGAIELRTGMLPILVATCAKPGGERMRFDDLRKSFGTADRPYLIMLGTGWGMTPELVQRAHIFLEPICGPGDYNHLSVRAAAGIILDRLFGKH